MQLKSLTLAACGLPLVAGSLVLEPPKMACEYLLHWQARSPAHINAPIVISVINTTKKIHITANSLIVISSSLSYKLSLD